MSNVIFNLDGCEIIDDGLTLTISVIDTIRNSTETISKNSPAGVVLLKMLPFFMKDQIRREIL